MKRWLRVSLVFQFILAAYFQLILWFRLGAWNDQPGKSLSELTRRVRRMGFASNSELVDTLVFWR
jgi:hypothetical protein